ncbi:MAG: hypothetical protein JJ931_07880 [Henriciella sp.]|nr:hypothetical protein [Henriciella sp.]MBO6695321.1 hypothetical protein [Henriciella sp.]
MLFLLNDTVIEIDAPEARVLARWRDMGCGDPRKLRASDAVEFAKTQLHPWMGRTAEADPDLLGDIAALIVSKTGANSLILKPIAGGLFEARLQDVRPLVLETFRAGVANDRDDRQSASA